MFEELHFLENPEPLTINKKVEIEKFLFSMYHEPLPPYEWAEAKLYEIVGIKKEESK